MMILALDPSSTVIGYAVLRADRSLIEAAAILPESRSDGSYDRIVTMGHDLIRVLDRHEPDVVLIEWTKGKVNKNRHGGLGAGLAVYGCGVGWAACTAWVWAKDHKGCAAVPILENVWTRGVPKSTRQLAIAAAYPQYADHVAEDPGGDISDAIGLADWWIQENRMRLFQ